MRKNYILLSCFLIFNITTLLSQNWVNNLGSNSVDQGRKIVKDAAGNSYVTGFFSGTMQLDASNVLSSAGQRDVFLAKYDPSGNLEWAKGIGGAEDDEGKDLAIDNLGNIYLVGEFRGFVDFDPSIGLALKNSQSESDIFIAQYDISGSFVRVNTIDGSGVDLAQNLELDNNGNIYITGLFSGTLDFVAGTSTDDLTTTQSMAAFVAKFTPTGSYVWAKKTENISSIIFNDLEIDNTGNLYLTGAYRSSTDFNPSTMTNILPLSGNTDAFLVKYNNNGSLIWAKAIHGIDIESAEAVKIAQDGNILVTGYFVNSIDLDPSTNTNFVTSVGQRDVFFANYSPSGSFRWGKSFGGTGNEYGYALATDNQKRIFLAGTFQGTADVNPDQNTTNNITSSADADVFFARYDSVGNYKWSMSAGGSNGELIQDIVVDNVLQIHATGWVQGTANFFGNTTINSNGDRDILVAKVDASILISTNKIVENEQVRVFPNPFDDHIELTFLEKNKGNISVQLTDMSGRVVFVKNKITENNSIIDLPNGLVNGVYFLQIFEKERVIQVVKLVK
ncbi:MAG: SBBP repeat-containing protein [Saprospiraceae bacterium]